MTIIEKKRRNSMFITPGSDRAVEWILNEARDRIPTQSSHKQLVSGTEHEHKSIMKLRTTPITWGIPLDEMMCSKFFTNFLHLNMMPWDSVITTESTYLPDARNYIHSVYLEKFKTSHLFMLDSDVIPPPDVVTTLLMHKKPIIGGWYRKKETFNYKDMEGNPQITARPVVYDWAREQDGKYWFTNRLEEGRGVEKIGGIGMGCVLMSHELAAQLGPRPYDMNSGGEDLVLCKKIMDLGVDLFVDWSVACAHVGISYV
jgi:hypothetical protein